MNALPVTVTDINRAAEAIGEAIAKTPLVPAPALSAAAGCKVWLKLETQHPTGELLLAKVHKRPCAFDLVAEFVHCENQMLEPGETVDLRQRGLKGFITAHKEIVTIFIGGSDHPYQIERGQHTVAQILGIVGQTPEGYVLLEEKDGPPLPVPPTTPVKISGCEMFYTQPQSGGSS